MTHDIDPCRGCTCSHCLLSEKNGAPYLCKEARCNKCEVSDTILKLANCPNTVRLDQEGDDFTLW